MDCTEKRVLVITGPTATGKTALAVELALRLGGEVISADSMQLYRGMDIGTAKATAEEMRGVRHHLLDVAAPEDCWSAARWVDAAAEAAEDVFSRGKVPVIAGGTGLYIDSLLSGRDFAENDSENAGVRERLGAEYDSIGGEAFREKLRAVDPERAEKLHPADRRRLIRAMEVWLLTGQTISAHDEETRSRPPRWASLRYALTFADRELLYRRIDLRVDKMVREGLFGEVKALLAAGLSPESTAMQAIGYKEAAAALRGECSEAEAIDAIKMGSRRYAKRQLTWLNRDEGLRWIRWGSEPDISAAADRIEREWSQPAQTTEQNRDTL